jgi:hypothetical protein
MATAKSDDESDVASHPLAENRPGVYVQVVSPRRRKKGKHGDSVHSSRPPAGKGRVAAREETDARVTAREALDPRAESDAPSAKGQNGKGQASSAAELSEVAAPLAAESSPGAAAQVSPEPERESAPVASEAVREGKSDDEDDGRQSGERPVDFDSLRAREAESENTNDRPDLLGMSLPPPPRLPSFSSPLRAERDIATDPPAHSASLLDAPHSLRPSAESTPAARSSSTLLFFVAVFSAIIVMAGMVALRELTKSEPKVVEQRASTNLAPAPAAAPVAPPAASEAQAPPSANEQVAKSSLPAAAAARRADVAPRVPAAHPSPKPPAAKALVAKAAAALRNLKNTGAQATPGAVVEEEAPSEEQDRLPDPDEPLELPGNPYR